MPARQNRHAMLAWRKSNASGGAGECVEIACEGQAVLVRDSHAPDAVLAFPSAQWSAFVRRIRSNNGSSARR